MIYELKAFQAEALSKLRDNLDSAQHEYAKNGIQQIISLTAPTGSGKTIIATNFIEDVLMGNEEYLEQPDAVFLWISDNLELNEQSKLKIERTADRLKFGQCVTIDADSFDQEVLDNGHIYFLNTQKLSKTSKLVKGGDGRDYTIWETFQNTIDEKGDKIIVIIDEAHRGMRNPKEAKEATTIMQKFIKGSEGDGLSSSFPIIVGMSATIARFEALVGSINATTRKVDIPASKVRESGLLKDEIKALYPENVSGRVDMAVLQAATDDWQKKCDHWDIFYSMHKSKRVLPVFLIQVENGTGKNISNTDLDEVIKTIEDRLGYSFTDNEVVHTFGEKATLTIKGLEVRYEEPSRIEDNKNIKVVLFKDALSVGWDCPRAETMISFRKANDATYIAQLLGRMFRTPLHQKVTTDEYLNSVYLFLPYFNKDTVEKIVSALKEEEIGSAVNVTSDPVGTSGPLTAIPPKPPVRKPFVKTTPSPDGKETVSPSNPGETTGIGTASVAPTPEENHPTTPGDYPKDPLADLPMFTKEKEPKEEELPGEPAKESVEDVREEEVVIDDGIDRESIIKYINSRGIPSYEVRKDKINDYLKSLFYFAGFLHQTGLYSKAVDDIKTDIAKMIHDYIEGLKEDGTYDEKVKDVLEFKLLIKTIGPLDGHIQKDLLDSILSTTDVDIDRQFNLAEKQLKNEGVGIKYVGEYAKAGFYNDYKVDVILFVHDKDAMDKLSEYAEAKYHDLIDEYKPRIKTLPKLSRDRFRRIINDGDAKSAHLLDLPFGIDPYTQNGKPYEKHLYIDYSTGTAIIKLNSWEEGLLETELKRDDFVCWLRNPDRRSWSLCIPYKKGGYWEKMYPDFIEIRKDGPNDYFIDILEPHDSSRIDNLAKAKGLADYAENDFSFGRVQLIRKMKASTGEDAFKRLDMSKSKVRTRVRSVSSNEELDHVFDELGFFE